MEDNLQSARLEIRTLIKAATKLVQEIGDISNSFDRETHSSWASFQVHSRSSELVPRYFYTDDPTHRTVDKEYAAHETRAVLEMNKAEAGLRHLRDVTAEADIGDEVQVDYTKLRRSTRLSQRFLAGPYPGVQYLAEVRSLASKLKDREMSSQSAREDLTKKLSQWDRKHEQILRDLQNKFQDIRESAELSTNQIANLESEARRKLIGPLQHAREGAQVVANFWTATSEEAKASAAGFAGFFEETERREMIFRHLRKSLVDIQAQLDAAKEGADRAADIMAIELRRLTLYSGSGPSAGLPIVGAGLRPITEIFQTKPPPVPGEEVYSSTGEFHKWFSSTFNVLRPQEQAVQIMHYFNPFYAREDRLVVIGDNLVAASRATALCASTHLRAGRIVTVYVPSQGVADLLRAVIYKSHYDVNLQQLVTGLNRSLSGEYTELALLHADYKIVVIDRTTIVPVAASGPKTPARPSTDITLFISPAQLPAARIPSQVDSAVKSPINLRLSFVADATPHGAPDEAWHLFGVPRQNQGGLRVSDELRSAYAIKMNGNVFALEPLVSLGTTAINRQVIRTPKVRLPHAQRAEDILAALVPSTAAESAAPSTPLSVLTQNVMQADIDTLIHTNMFQVVYLGSDTDTTDPQLVTRVVQAFRDRYGYSDPDEPLVQDEFSERRAVAMCNSLEEWRRLQSLPPDTNRIAIYVFPRINDPALASAINGRVSILHQFLPILYSEELRRVERQFSPTSMTTFDWGVETSVKLRSLLPGPLELAQDIKQIVQGLAVNATF